MERIHYLIGAIIFLLCALASAAGGKDTPFNPDDWYTSPHVAPYKVGKGYSIDARHYVIACTILAEARGEGKAGMYAVACVIEQRTRSRFYPNHAHLVCFEKDQFSCWNAREGKSTRWKFQHNDLMWHYHAPYALALAVKMLNGLDNNKEGLKLSWIKNADHYCRVNVNNYWTRKSKPIAIVGGHKFFKLRPASNKK
tara:strand:- start:613 stop:1203 length:591 start_codon:yes stop_codon:yes gene_type:complete